MAVIIATNPGENANDKKVLKYHKFKRKKTIKNILFYSSVGLNIIVLGVCWWIILN